MQGVLVYSLIILKICSPNKRTHRNGESIGIGHIGCNPQIFTSSFLGIAAYVSHAYLKQNYITCITIYTFFALVCVAIH